MPGQKQAPYQWEIDYDQLLAALKTPYLEVHGVFPHMHGYGVIAAGGDRARAAQPGPARWT